MFALQDRMSLRCAPIVAALRAKLNRDTEKYLRIENSRNYQILQADYPVAAWHSHYSPAAPNFRMTGSALSTIGG
jgi:hypothetical protein